MKKLITVLLTVLAMYVTAKWPDKVIAFTEVGYRVVKVAVSQGAATISSARSSESTVEAGGEDAVEL